MPLLKLYSRKVIFDLKPKSEYRITAFGFEPSGALSIRVGNESTMLTFAEVEPLVRALALWLVTRQ